MPGRANRLSEEREHKLIKERIAFARRLNNLMSRDADICYMDETTFNIWDPPKRTWMQKNCKMIVPINLKKLQNITLYGAIGKSLKGPTFMMAKSTNQYAFKLFIR